MELIPVYGYHNNNILITRESYKYIREYKKQLLQNVTNLLTDLSIKFVISEGNLLEYERGSPIFHDDDLDIRFDVKDIQKWEQFCSNNNSRLENYNLVFDARIKNIEGQKQNGIQCWLTEFKNPLNNPVYKMDIHCDLIPSKVHSDSWIDVDFTNFSNLRKIKLYDVETFAPSKEDSRKFLKIGYGDSYIIPIKHCEWKLVDNIWVLHEKVYHKIDPVSKLVTEFNHSLDISHGFIPKPSFEIDSNNEFNHSLNIDFGF